MNSIVYFLFASAVAYAIWVAVATGASASRLDAGPLPWFVLFIGAATSTVAARAAAHHDTLLLAASVAGITACAIGDARTGLLFDRATLLLSAILVAIALVDRGALHAFAGAAVVVAPLAALWGLTRGAGIGLGDVKLAIPIGLGLGVHAGLGALGAAFVFGAGTGLFLLARGASRGAAIRFGPFLAAGTAISALFPISSVLP